jgi:hypothetical protein
VTSTASKHPKWITLFWSLCLGVFVLEPFNFNSKPMKHIASGRRSLSHSSLQICFANIAIEYASAAFKYKCFFFMIPTNPMNPEAQKHKTTQVPRVSTLQYMLPSWLLLDSHKMMISFQQHSWPCPSHTL